MNKNGFPDWIHTKENGTKPNEGVFISWEEHAFELELKNSDIAKWKQVAQAQMNLERECENAMDVLRKALAKVIDEVHTATIWEPCKRDLGLRSQLEKAIEIGRVALKENL